MQTRQANWQQERRARGLCCSCGKRPLHKCGRCKECLIVHRNMNRSRQNSKPRQIRGVTIDDEKAYLRICKEICTLYRTGKSALFVGTTFGISEITVRNICRRLNVPIRKRGRMPK